MKATFAAVRSRSFIIGMPTIYLLALALAGTGCAPEKAAPLPIEEYNRLDVASAQTHMASGALTAVSLTQYYLDRIAEIDDAGPTLNAVIELNPAALRIAAALDEEREKSGPRGPLHGVPVLLKANIDTRDSMATTAGSMALAGYMPGKDAFLVARLRDAGAVVLGMANLSEWANYRSTNSSSGWSSLAGQNLNPYVLDRGPCGSSSGPASAVAADMAVLSVGTETNGSIMCPASFNGVVGVKPTLGLVSRD
ncbi:MAG: amidase, partial [Rhodothermales bacterium]